MHQVSPSPAINPQLRIKRPHSYSTRLALLALMSTGCRSQPNSQDAAVTPIGDTITFAGRNWLVKVGEMMGPGNNRWSADNVAVDSDGLHLRIAREGNHWNCAEVFLAQSLGAGCYTFVIGSLQNTDINAVAGLFLYRDDEHEFDVELGQFGIRSHPGAQYVIQPINDATVASHRRQFSLAAATNQITTHTIFLSPDHVTFGSYLNIGTTSPLQTWTYQNMAPITTDGVVHINYWLFNSQAPVDNHDHELIVKDFIFSQSCSETHR